jgi:adenine-specific DNA-methyltransferase
MSETKSNKLEYSDISKSLTKILSKIDKKKNGIYFTPPSCVYKNLELLKKYIPYNKQNFNVLEPSCGSCEYINGLISVNNTLNITGIELNKKIYESIKYLNSDKISILNTDFLTFNLDTLYNLIIGNPPYYVMKKKDVDKKYYSYFDGRPNIFILFLIKSLELLKDNGILSFILPKNFINCLYYDKTRKHIEQNYQIIDIVECDNKYIETEQDTILFIVKKQKNINNTDFVLNNNTYTIFSTKNNIQKIKELYTHSKSLNELGFVVNVGNVVWNQCKDILTDDNTKTRLIYSSDIKNNRLIQKEYSNKQKKNFIDKKGITEIMLVINRGYGVGEYNFDYCLINQTYEYLIENHLICIRYKDDVDKNRLLDLYDKIILSLNDKRTKEFIKLYFGNNSINTTELNYILPIYM